MVAAHPDPLAPAHQCRQKIEVAVDNALGALPDRSVTDALQRLPGISINRFAGSNDPDHFSVEGSGVVIRSDGCLARGNRSERSAEPGNSSERSEEPGK